MSQPKKVNPKENEKKQGKKFKPEYVVYGILGLVVVAIVVLVIVIFSSSGGAGSGSFTLPCCS